MKNTNKHAGTEVLYKFREAPGKHAGKRYDEQPGYIKSSTHESEKTIIRKFENDRYDREHDADTN